MKNSNNTTTAKDWLEMDLKMQSGSIYIARPNPSKKKYKISSNKDIFLKPDTIKYGGRIISSEIAMLD